MLRRSFASRFNKVAIWGGGTMGGGIAQVTATAGIQATVVEVTDERCNQSKKTITGSLARVAKKKFDGDEAKQADWVNGVLSKITFTTSVEAAASDADLIIEAIVEQLEAKRELWSKVDSIAKKECVFATNTSSLHVFEQAAVTKRADRFGGLHFFSPVPMMKLVEVVRSETTSEPTVQQLNDFVKRIGKTPVVTKDTKGFIVNRLLIPSMLEACRLVERGVATVQDTDIAMKLGAGHPMGPFELADSVGIDVLKLIVDAWHKNDPTNTLFLPSKLIDEKVAQGKLGRKSGEGFYKYK